MHRRAGGTANDQKLDVQNRTTGWGSHRQVRDAVASAWFYLHLSVRYRALSLLDELIAPLAASHPRPRDTACRRSSD